MKNLVVKIDWGNWPSSKEGLRGEIGYAQNNLNEALGRVENRDFEGIVGNLCLTVKVLGRLLLGLIEDNPRAKEIMLQMRDFELEESEETAEETAIL